MNTHQSPHPLPTKDGIMNHLRRIGRDAGMEEFQRGLLPSIFVPAPLPDRPHRDYILAANQRRGWG